MRIQMMRISDLPDFKPKEFSISPKHWGYKTVYYQDASELLEKAKKLAEDIDGICFAIIYDGDQEYVLGELCDLGFSTKFILFNAKKTLHLFGEVRAITYNTKIGLHTRYLYDRAIKFHKGSIV